MSCSGNHFGAQCNFSCAIGHRLNGSSTVTCVAPGNRPPGVWDNPLPSCQGITKKTHYAIHFFSLIPLMFLKDEHLNRITD